MRGGRPTIAAACHVAFSHSNVAQFWQCLVSATGNLVGGRLRASAGPFATPATTAILFPVCPRVAAGVIEKPLFRETTPSLCVVPG